MAKNQALATLFFFAAMCAAAEGGPIAVSTATQTALGEAPANIALKAQGQVSAPVAGRCFVVISGLTANRPVGTGYRVSIATTSGTKSANRGTALGSFGFYDAIGVASNQSVPVSLEAPSRYCVAANKDKIVVTISPDRGPVAGSKPLIGAVKLITQ